MNATTEIEARAESVLTKMTHLQLCFHDDERRSRRFNLLFVGLENAVKETWAESEKLVLEMCSAGHDIHINPDAINRAPDIGQFYPNTKITIIVTFASFKRKEPVLR